MGMQPHAKETQIETHALSRPLATVLLADSFREESLKELEVLGCQADLNPALSDDALLSTIAENKPDILVVRSTKVTVEMMDASERLSLIIGMIWSRAMSPLLVRMIIIRSLSICRRKGTLKVML